MDNKTDIVSEWCTNIYGQMPEDLVFWAEEVDILQVFIKLTQQIVIADFFINRNSISSSKHMAIGVDSWSPGAIQTRRMANGSVRFKHKQEEIFLAARIQTHESAQALLEEWLMEMRGNSVKPRERSRRISDLKRTRDTIERLLEQSDLNLVTEMIEQVTFDLEKAEIVLSD